MKNNKYVNALIERLNIEFSKGDRSGVYGYTQRTMAYNSNKIEGSTLTIEQTATLFDTQTLVANGEIIRAKDVEEMTGHFMMFNHMLKTLEDPLTEELIKQFHYQLKAGVFEDMANGYPCGEYKNRRNMVSVIEVALPDEVPEKMREYLSEYLSKKDPELIDLAVMHAAFEKIHPFQDGNGRTGRIVLFRECLKNNIVPLIIHDDNKAEYNNALKEQQLNKNIKPLYDLFVREQNDYFEKTDLLLDAY